MSGMRSVGVISALALLPLSSVAFAQSAHEALIARHAAANSVPESLVRRVIKIESTGNPRLVSKGNYGLMQIRLGTAKAMGYGGGADGLLDADTNMTYAVKYLAGAYRLAGGDENRAVGYYQRGYYYAAKAKGVAPYPAGPVLASASSETVVLPKAMAAAKPAAEPETVVVKEPAHSKQAERRKAKGSVGAPFNLLAYLVDHGMSPEDKQRLRKRRAPAKTVAAR